MNQSDFLDQPDTNSILAEAVDSLRGVLAELRMTAGEAGPLDPAIPHRLTGQPHERLAAAVKRVALALRTQGRTATSADKFLESMLTEAIGSIDRYHGLRKELRGWTLETYFGDD